MVGLSALWMPIVVSAAFVFIALALIHGMLGWHKGDMTAVPGEAKVMEMLRGLNVQPGFAARLRKEYNVEPSAETVRLAERIRNGDHSVTDNRPS